MQETIKLTSLASAAGCAAKLGAGDLSKIVFPLGNLFAPAEYPNLLIGLETPDDAAVMKLNDEQALIMTTDFFPPVVDDPYWFGAIAAANALSDVYAMGGDVLMALNLVCFPAELDPSVLTAILQGGADKVKEAGGVVVGGHTIMDQEPKYGLAVVGMVHPAEIMPKGGAQVGDKLNLTKPLGVGTINTAVKRGIADPRYVKAAVETMATLNRAAAEIGRKHAVHGISDITGYSLMGHAYEMAQHSHTSLHIEYDKLHWVAGVDEYAAEGVFPGGMGRNKAYYSKWVSLAEPLQKPDIEGRLYDPQTSGGLLMAVAASSAEALLQELVQQGVQARLIGEVLPATHEGHIVVQ